MDEELCGLENQKDSTNAQYSCHPLKVLSIAEAVSKSGLQLNSYIFVTLLHASKRIDAHPLVCHLQEM